MESKGMGSEVGDLNGMISVGLQIPWLWVVRVVRVVQGRDEGFIFGKGMNWQRNGGDGIISSCA
jgi:hypothetical protein